MPVLIDLVNEALIASGLALSASAATAQGGSNDFSDGCDPLGMVVAFNTVIGATTGIVQCEESTNGSAGWTLISGMQVTFTTTPSLTAPLTARGLRTQQYVRLNFATLTGTTTPAITGTGLLIQQRKYIPVNKSGTDRSPSS